MSMKQVRFDPTISAGNLIQAIVLITGIIAGWVNLNNRVDLNTRDIRLMQETVNKLTETQNIAIRNLEVLTVLFSEHKQQQTGYMGRSKGQ